MDGRYDDDRAYVYTYGTKTGRQIDSNLERALIALRVAPSVDNGIPGGFGERELSKVLVTSVMITRKYATPSLCTWFQFYWQVHSVRG